MALVSRCAVQIWHRTFFIFDSIQNPICTLKFIRCTVDDEAAFADGEKPESKSDPIIEERKRKEAARAEELKAAREKLNQEGFEPRKVSTVESL